MVTAVQKFRGKEVNPVRVEVCDIASDLGNCAKVPKKLVILIRIKNMPNIEEITARFRIEGRFVSARLLGSGHINDSYLVTTEPGLAPDYVLQRINGNIFTNIPELINNILKVTFHLNRRLQTAPQEYRTFQVIRLIQSVNSAYYYRDREEHFWRMYNHVTDSVSYDVIGNDSIAFEAGRAFGLFQYLTSDMDPSGLFEVLPGFHDAQLRLSNFRKSVERDVAGRRSAVTGEIRFTEARADEMQQIKRLGDEGKIPLRVTHNDTKCNNVLFSPEDKAIAIVDLDTIMPGYSLYDFGDAIRTGTNTAGEDEQNLDKVGINLELFESYTGGYLSVALPSLNQVELEHLAFSARYMTWLIGLRFLTDYLDGDVYYKTSFPEHNLHRARAQFKLLESMEMNAQKMEAIIDNQQTKYRSAHET